MLAYCSGLLNRPTYVSTYSFDSDVWPVAWPSRPGEPMMLCSASFFITSSDETPYRRMLSGFSQIRIAKMRLPRFRGMPMPLIRLSRGMTNTLAKLNRNFWSAFGSVL